MSTGSAVKDSATDSASGQKKQPILPLAIQARLDARLKTKKTEEHEADVFSSAPIQSTSTKEPVKATEQSRARQPFKPMTMAAREAETAKKAPAKSTSMTSRSKVTAGTKVTAPQAKLVISPRQPRVKLKPPVPSAVTKKPGTSTKVEPAAKVRVPLTAVSNKSSSMDSDKRQTPDSKTTTPASPKKLVAKVALVNLEAANKVPLPPSPVGTPRSGARHMSDGHVALSMTPPMPDPFVLDSPRTDQVFEQEAQKSAEQIALPDSDHEVDDHGSSSPTLTPSKVGKVPSTSSLLDSQKKLVARDDDSDGRIGDERDTVEACSPAPSSLAETIPCEWESDVQTEDEVDEDGDGSRANVTFKVKTTNNSLAKTVAKKLLVDQLQTVESYGSADTEDEKENEDVINPFRPPSTTPSTIPTKTCFPSEHAVLSESKRNQSNTTANVTPVSTTPAGSPRRPRVRQLQAYFEKLSPVGDAPIKTSRASVGFGESTPSGRVRVRTISMEQSLSTTPVGSPVRMTAL